MSKALKRDIVQYEVREYMHQLNIYKLLNIVNEAKAVRKTENEEEEDC